MPLTTAALASEIQNDPAGYGPYTGLSDSQVADVLNHVRDGTAPAPHNGEAGAAILVRRDDISAQEIMQAIQVSDYQSLPANPNATQLSTERRFLAWLTGVAAVNRVRLLNDDGTDGPVIANFNAMFPAGSGTRNRLAALANRFGSRAEELFGSGVAVQPSDVAAARGV